MMQAEKTRALETVLARELAAVMIVMTGGQCAIRFAGMPHALAIAIALLPLLTLFFMGLTASAMHLPRDGAR